MAAEADGIDVDGGGEVKQNPEQNQNKPENSDIKSEAPGVTEVAKENESIMKNENDESNNIEKENNSNNQNPNNEDNPFDEETSEQLDDENKNGNLIDISKETLDLSLSIDQNEEVLPSDKENETENNNEERFRVDRKQLENLLKGENTFELKILHNILTLICIYKLCVSS